MTSTTTPHASCFLVMPDSLLMSSWLRHRESSADADREYSRRRACRVSDAQRRGGIIPQSMIHDPRPRKPARKIPARLRVEANLSFEEPRQRIADGLDRWLVHVHARAPFVDGFRRATQAGRK